MQIETVRYTTHLLDQNPGHPDHQMPVRMWSSRRAPSWLLGMRNGVTTLEDRWAALQKTEHIPTIHSSKHLLGIHPKELNTSVHTKLAHGYL